MKKLIFLMFLILSIGINSYCQTRLEVPIKYSRNIDLKGLGNDTTITTGDEIQITPGSGFPYYFWNTGEMTGSILVSNLTTGEYQYTIMYSPVIPYCFQHDTINVTVIDQATNLFYNALDDISIYPNPVNKGFFLQSEKFSIISVKVYNSTGELVKQFNSNLNYFDISDLNSGYYIIQMKSNRYLSYKKILKL